MCPFFKGPKVTSRWMHTVVLCLLFQLGGTGWCQQQLDLDSLEAAIPQMENLRDQWNAYRELAMAKRFYSPRSVFNIGQKMLSVAKKMDNDSLIANSYSIMGTAKTVVDEYNEAVTYFTEGIRFAKRSKHTSVERTIHLNLGTVFFELGNHERGKSQLKKALTLIDPDAPPRTQEHILNNLGVAYEMENKLDSALLMLQKAKQTIPAGSTDRKAINNVNQALVYVKLGDHATAHRLNLDAIQALRGTQFHDKKVTAYVGATGTAISMQKPENARLYLDSAFYFADLNGTPNEWESVLKARSDYLERTGQYKEALKAHQQYVQFKDSFSIAMQEDRIGELQAQMNQAELEASAELYRAESEVEQQKRLRQNTWLWVISIGLGTVLIGVGFLLVALVTRSRTNRDLKEKNALIVRQNELLKEQKETLEDLNREKEGLISVVAHDLKSPLNKSLALVNMIESSGPLTRPQSQAVDMIRKSNRDGTALIRDLLELNASEMQRGPLEQQLIEINSFLQELSLGFAAEAERKGIALDIALPEEVLKINAHRISLARVLENLISNALKFSPAQTVIKVSARKLQNKIEIAVQDQGPGISASDQAKLFKKFQRLSAKPTGGESSTGLGLAITRALVEKLNGHIEVKSELGKGTQFLVRLESA